jgi:hypothetical protein
LNSGGTISPSAASFQVTKVWPWRQAALMPVTAGSAAGAGASPARARPAVRTESSSTTMRMFIPYQ